MGAHKRPLLGSKSECRLHPPWGSIGFLALNFGLSGGDISVVYPLTASAPLFTLAFTALMLKGTERLTWRIVIGASAVVAGVIFL